jgi:hypothetical protein
MELEGRELLSTFTGHKAVHHGDLDTLRPAAGTPALNHIVLRVNSARVDRGLPDDGSTTRRDVAIGNNAVHQGSGLSGAPGAIHALRVHSRRAATGPIISQTFNGTQTPPQGWVQFTQYGTVAQSPTTFLTLTDTKGSSAGIMSIAKTVPFSPVGVGTKMTAVISKISPSPLGNAVFGLLGMNGTTPVGELAAGIDAEGNVFAVVYDPASKISQPTIVPVKPPISYTGGSITITFSINSTGVQITAGKKTFTLSFSKDLHNFSLNTAFPNGAIPALVGASQPTQEGGAASFQSISVSTSPGGAKAHRRSG